MTPSLILVALSALQITPTLQPTPPATLVPLGPRRLAQPEIEPAGAGAERESEEASVVRSGRQAGGR